MSALEKEFHDILRALDEAALDLQNDRFPALQPLESRMIALCTQVAAAPPPQARQIQPLMGQAIHKLDLLAQDLQAYTERMKP